MNPAKRVPRDFKTLDADEVLAEHIVHYEAGNGEILSRNDAMECRAAARRRAAFRLKHAAWRPASAKLRRASKRQPYTNW